MKGDQGYRKKKEVGGGVKEGEERKGELIDNPGTLNLSFEPQWKPLISRDPAFEESTPQADQRCITRATTLVEPRPLPFDESHQYRIIMHLTRRTRLQAKKVDWADLSDNPPSYIEIK